MDQLNLKLEEVSSQKNTEVLRKFMAMAVLGVLESYVLNQFHVGIEEIAKQVGELLEQIILQAQITSDPSPCKTPPQPLC